jgi:hypothetical protein
MPRRLVLVFASVFIAIGVALGVGRVYLLRSRRGT